MSDIDQLSNDRLISDEIKLDEFNFPADTKSLRDDFNVYQSMIQDSLDLNKGIDSKFNAFQRE